MIESIISMELPAEEMDASGIYLKREYVRNETTLNRNIKR